MDKKMKSYDELPLVLNAADIQSIMGISRVSTYELVRTPGFPVIRSGRLIKISKKAFLIGWQKEVTHNATHEIRKGNHHQL